MGEVYRAHDTRLGRDIAIKVLPAEVASSPERRARFRREARTVAGLNHPNIVTLFSVEDEGGVPYLTMELVEGQTLSTIILPGGLPLPRFLDLAIPLTEALVAAHEKSVIHRDLKPGNVMVTHDGRVKVLDFGLAKMIGADAYAAQETTLTATAVGPISGEGHVVGTMPYMAPEQLRGETVDARSDLFSLGIILYELATGRRPFQGNSSVEVISSILRDAPEPLSRVRSDLPRELEEIVNRCLEKSARARTQSVQEVNIGLRRLRNAPERGPGTAASYQVASIAVLPFVNRSASADDEYFSEGLADELLNVLSKIKGLRVTARTSSFQFKATRDDVATIGRKLNVATLLDGSVRKAGNRVRINVELVNVADSSHLWSETYDRTLDDILAVQDDIAQSVVRELRAALLGEDPDARAPRELSGEVAAAGRGRGKNGESHRLYLQGRYFVERGTREETEEGMAYLRRAIEADPSFALAWAEVARAWLNNANGAWVPPRTAAARARQAAERALELEPDLAEGYARLGAIQRNWEWDWRAADSSYRRALDLAPGSSVALEGAGVLAESFGRFEEAIGLMQRAVEQDPLSSGAYSNLALVYLAADYLAEAEQACRKAMALSPQRICLHSHLALILLARGGEREALTAALAEPEEVYRLLALAIVHDAAGRRESADEALGALIARHARDWAYQVAEIYAARGARDEAFEWLDRAYAARDAGLADLRPDPLLRSLHGDPRWEAFLKKMGLEN